jgi:hypothetical protein
VGRLRVAPRRGGGGPGAARPGGGRRRGAVLHVGDDRRAQGRPLLPPRAGAAHPGDLSARRLRPRGAGRDPPGGAHVPCQRVGAGARGGHDRRHPGAAGSAAVGRAPGGAAGDGAGHVRGGGADGVDGRARRPPKDPGRADAGAAHPRRGCSFRAGAPGGLPQGDGHRDPHRLGDDGAHARRDGHTPPRRDGGVVARGAPSGAHQPGDAAPLRGSARGGGRRDADAARRRHRGRAGGAWAVGVRGVLPGRGDRQPSGRLAAHGGRRDGRRRRLRQAGGPHQGPDPQRWGVDLQRPARARAHGPSVGGRGRRRRGPGSAMAGAPVGVEGSPDGGSPTAWSSWTRFPAPPRGSSTSGRCAGGSGRWRSGR